MSTEKAPLIPLWHLHSKREKLACITDFARWKLGLLDKYLNPDFSRVERVIFVCKGNICRSAYAEAKFNQLAAGAVSVGTQARDGMPANEDALRLASARGVDLSGHKTRNLASLEYKKGDLFVCMELQHALTVDARSPTVSGWFSLLLGGVQGLPRVSDPYGESDGYFEQTFDRIDALLGRTVELLRQAGAPVGTK